MIVSPLRYPGGKARLYQFFVEMIKRNRLFNLEYSEPYAGGAGLALKLLANGFVSKVSLNDIDPAIYAFWVSILNETKFFCELVKSTPITVEEWHKQKAIWSKADKSNTLELGFATYFLNRTSRSGIIEGAGPIGGYAQQGEWKIDARFIKEKQIENIIAISSYSHQITLSNEDALRYIRNRINNERILFYLDPPYYVKGSKLYKNFYKHNDHLEIARSLEENRRKTWIVSYDDTPQIRDIYKNFSAINYVLQYSAGKKTFGHEVIYLSDTLVPPDSSSL